MKVLCGTGTALAECRAPGELQPNIIPPRRCALLRTNHRDRTSWTSLFAPLRVYWGAICLSASIRVYWVALTCLDEGIRSYLVHTGRQAASISSLPGPNTWSTVSIRAHTSASTRLCIELLHTTIVACCAR